MATAGATGDDLKKELTCAICLDFFKDPVILKCGHNFCRFCICMHWDENGGDYGYQCPQCRTVFNKRSFTKNYLVQNLVAKLDDLEHLGSSPAPSKSMKPDGRCEQHGEELKLYCQTDKRPILPQNLTLDPDTAHANLLISDFDTKVEEGRVRSQEPDLPGRFNRFCGVLATAQYASGQHYWEVDVRDKGVWYLGVTTECSNRKGFVNLTPSAGYWSLCLQDRLYANVEDGRIPLADYWNSPRVGVYLDYDNGRLSFYDAVTMKRLYMFNTCFEEPVYPFFSPGKNDVGSRLQICHYY
ncbi:hypothetical protein GOODEAATRI_022125 [Goodea atripinnis]|uniref:Uncharacterized protein n=1 Tax=Goodea atripinnis TaxID=208336 RepID=A0ABV0Q031_9TELE